MRFQVEAIDPPLLGIPNYRGAVQTESGSIADIICTKESAQILSIRTKDGFHHITAERAARRRESDIIFAEDSMGELAKILIFDDKKTYKEQAAELLQLGLSRRGAFSKTTPLPAPDHPVSQCVLAGLCIYFFQLELVYNSEGSFG